MHNLGLTVITIFTSCNGQINTKAVNSEKQNELLTKCDKVRKLSNNMTALDTTVAESFFNTIKTEHIVSYEFKNQDVAKSVIFRYIEAWYNTNRIHSTLNGESP